MACGLFDQKLLIHCAFAQKTEETKKIDVATDFVSSFSVINVWYQTLFMITLQSVCVLYAFSLIFYVPLCVEMLTLSSISLTLVFYNASICSFHIYYS